ncbi:hypothetical protein KDK95_08615 [Actinospica sp. MGRD01-02]|uniref:Uncharacterized protein n=1 Tax=Actinospica acidithermotolerans TaxID=2828514 RepID=A0A941IK43_9ACTN|nr:hypothetical protein [Actinospica acidithermotolerans]MBR7826361.1 hypothetical protein [Actinospica acidithermotolerans]
MNAYSVPLGQVTGCGGRKPVARDADGDPRLSVAIAADDSGYRDISVLENPPAENGAS